MTMPSASGLPGGSRDIHGGGVDPHGVSAALRGSTSPRRGCRLGLVAIRQFSGAVTPRWSVSDAGAGRVRAEAIDGGPALKMMMPVIIFDTSSEDGLRITAVEFRRE